MEKTDVRKKGGLLAFQLTKVDPLLSSVLVAANGGGRRKEEAVAGGLCV